MHHPVAQIGRRTESAQRLSITYRWIGAYRRAEQRSEGHSALVFERRRRQAATAMAHGASADFGEETGLADPRRPFDQQHRPLPAQHSCDVLIDGSQFPRPAAQRQC